MEGSEFRRISLHCITVSSDDQQKYKLNASTSLEQYSVLAQKEQWGDFFTRLVIVST